MKKIIYFFAIAALMASCAPKQTPEAEAAANDTTARYHGFRQLPVDSISNDLFLINHDWMLVTGGVDTAFNSMTASWGGFGTVWQLPVAFMTIRTSRYTYAFLMQNDYYTISFYDASFKDTLQMLGSKSGRDSDKIKESGLTPLQMPTGAMGYEQARMIIECRKIYRQNLAHENILDTTIRKDIYKSADDIHDLFFGEIVGVWKK